MTDLTNFLILLLISNHDCYAYELIKDISNLSDGCISVNQNTVYTALYKLKDGGYINEYSVRVGRKRTRVYYTMENLGIEYLFDLYKDYKKTVTGVSWIIDNLKSANIEKLKGTKESNDNE